MVLCSCLCSSLSIVEKAFVNEFLILSSGLEAAAGATHSFDLAKYQKVFNRLTATSAFASPHFVNPPRASDEVCTTHKSISLTDERHRPIVPSPVFLNWSLTLSYCWFANVGPPGCTYCWVSQQSSRQQSGGTNWRSAGLAIVPILHSELVRLLTSLSLLSSPIFRSAIALPHTPFLFHFHTHAY